MESNLSIEDWNAIVERAYPLEFGWLGIDERSQLAYFSTYGQSYIPPKALVSYEKYVELAEIINNLPEIGLSNLCYKGKGWFNTWHFHSRRGIVGYDYMDVHRKEEYRLGQYDLITQPEVPIFLDSIPDIISYVDIIPRFKLSFCMDLQFSQLVENEI